MLALIHERPETIRFPISLGDYASWGRVEGVGRDLSYVRSAEATKLPVPGKSTDSCG